MMPKTRTCGSATAFLLALMVCAAYGAAKSKSTQKTGLFRNQRLADNPDPNAWYHLWVPPDYRRSKPMPMYVFLHGGHVGAGTADNIVACHQIVPRLKESITVFPNHMYWFWSHPDESLHVIKCMEQAMKTYNIDRKRIYVMGSSMGGNGAMHMAAEFPEMFAACAPLSCWCQYIPVQKAAVMPIYCSHGTKDTTVPIKWARDIRKRLEGMPGLKLEYHELDYGHQPPTEVMIKATDWMSQFANPRQFDITAMKERAARLPMKEWMKRAEYQRDYANARAWTLLTCENEKLRDYPQALELARKADGLAKGRNPAILDTLALALFRNGKVEEAVSIQEKAIGLLDKKTPAELRNEFNDRLKQYQAASKR